MKIKNTPRFGTVSIMILTISSDIPAYIRYSLLVCSIAMMIISIRQYEKERKSASISHNNDLSS